MTTYGYNGDVVATGINANAVTILSFDNVYVAQGATLMATGAGGCGIRGDYGDRVMVAGDVFGDFIGIYFDDSTGGDNVTVNSTGSVASTSYGVYLSGPSNRLANAGDISAYYAVTLGGGNGQVKNSGTIQADGVAISVYGAADQTNSIVNSGQILATNTAINSEDANDSVFNSGLISGIVDLGAGNDVFDNTNGTLQGNLVLGVGNDLLESRRGTLQGLVDLGEGNDTAYGSAAADVIGGGAQADLIRGGGGDDTLDGGANGDIVDYRDKTGAVVVTLNRENQVTVTVASVAEDTIKSFSGVLGGSGNDKFTGDTASNRLEGNSGDDALSGVAENDTLIGGSGKDTLTGGVGNDSLTGGADADHFRFREAATSANRDTITDFVHGTDKIMLDDAIFVALGSSVTSSEFIAKTSGNVATNSSQHIIYDKSNGKLWYDADGNGSTAALQVAQLGTTASHPTNLTYADFGIV